MRVMRVKRENIKSHGKYNLVAKVLYSRARMCTFEWKSFTFWWCIEKNLMFFAQMHLVGSKDPTTRGVWPHHEGSIANCNECPSWWGPPKKCENTSRPFQTNGIGLKQKKTFQTLSREVLLKAQVTLKIIIRISRSQLPCKHRLWRPLAPPRASPSSLQYVNQKFDFVLKNSCNNQCAYLWLEVCAWCHSELALCSSAPKPLLA